jgi:hypothetical protein
MSVDLARLAAIMQRMPRRKTGRPPGRPKGEPRELLLLRVRPDQAEALRKRAAKERDARGGKRLDISSVLRALLDKVLRLRPPKA